MRLLRTASVLCVLPLFVTPARGDVQRVEIESVESVLDGREFGEAGSYEKLRGKIHFALDPDNPANARIVDLKRAPRNAEGLVEAWGDLLVLRPTDAEKSSRTALLEVSNRGGAASLGYFQGGGGGANPTRAAHFGDGLLMNAGMTLIWVGWQFDVPASRRGAFRLNVPRASGGDVEITGLVRSDWTVDASTTLLDLAHRQHVPYEVSDPAHADNVLTVRDGRNAPRSVVPREEWQFAVTRQDEVVEDRTRIYAPGSFEAGKIYELVYRAADPAIVGLGMAAIRDTMSYAKYDDSCPFPVERGIAVGISQTGRFLRHFLHQGFNTDERGEQVFDGMLIHTAGAGRGSFNHRFAQPSRDAHRYSAFFYPTDLFPFSGRAQRDPVTGRRAGLLPARHRPKVFYTNTGYEYWGRAASLLHTSVDGSADVEPLPEERIYHLASTQHFPVGFPPGRRTRKEGAAVWRGNPVALLRTERALLMALFAWVRDGEEPPSSAYPRIDAGTLVPVDQLGFPSVPGLEPPKVAHVAYRADYGPRFRSEGIVDVQPPELGPEFPALVSRVDAFGNEVAGVQNVETLVPLATYAPWNLRYDLPGPKGELRDFYGSFAPLSVTRVEGDARPSLDQTYPSKDEYLTKAEEAAARLVDERFLLPQDVAPALARAEALWDWVHEQK